MGANEKREAPFHGSDDAARVEAERRYRGPRMYVGTTTDREVFAFQDGAAWQAARPVVVSEADEREALADDLADALNAWSGALPDQMPQAESLHRSMMLALADAAMARRSQPAPRTVTAEQRDKAAERWRITTRTRLDKSRGTTSTTSGARTGGARPT